MTLIPDHPDIRTAELTGYPDDPVICENCDLCDADIYEGDIYYRVFGHVLCKDCMDACEEEARYEP